MVGRTRVISALMSASRSSDHVIGAGRRLDFSLTGGPSFFRVKQDFVSTVTYSETYPYDTASFTAATFSTATKVGVGFNVGADVTFLLVRNVGIGGLMRFSHGSLDLPLGSDTVTVKLGGIQAGGGVRLLF